MIKALGGLNCNQSAKNGENESPLNGENFKSAENNQPLNTEVKAQKAEQPNLMAQALLRHEQIANRIKRS